MDKKPTYVVRQPIETAKGDTVWRTIGSAWKKDNDTISVALDSLPINGQVVLVEPKDEDTQKA